MRTPKMLTGLAFILLASHVQLAAQEPPEPFDGWQGTVGCAKCDYGDRSGADECAPAFKTNSGLYLLKLGASAPPAIKDFLSRIKSGKMTGEYLIKGEAEEMDGTKWLAVSRMVAKPATKNVVVSETLDEAIGAGGAGTGERCFRNRSGTGRKEMVNRHKGSKHTEASVDLGLEWLATHQEEDGHWNAAKYGSNSGTDTACTGLGLLAFLGAGHSEKVGKYQTNVKKAVAWLKSKQDGKGLVFGDAKVGNGVGYSHAIAGMALAEACGMGDDPETKAAAQKALDYSTQVHQHRDENGKLGFRYAAGQAGDLSVTGWFMMQIKSARMAGLNVDPGCVEGVSRFLDSVKHQTEHRKDSTEDLNGSHNGQHKKIEGNLGYGYMPGGASTHRLSAIGILCRQLTGVKKEELQEGAEWFVEKGGLPETWGAKTDLYYWYYGTMCTFQQKGEIWVRWNEAMKRTLVDNQKQDGEVAGSWDPVGEYAQNWGRVGQTALCVLTLEVYYRYLSIYR